MNIIKAKFIIICDDEFHILEDKAIAFDEKIQDIDEFGVLEKRYPNASLIDHSNDILMPAFINPHTHLEFSSNVTSLEYGDFVRWVKSIVKLRNTLSDEAKNEVINKAINSMLKSGVGTIGEISSFGSDLFACANSQARFVFFSEILGTDESQNISTMAKFYQRFEAAFKRKNSKFIPALSVHSPYSTNSNLVKEALKFARENELLVSTHFLESSQEKQWLQSSNGEFLPWLSSFRSAPKSSHSPLQYLENFHDIRTLFTHCVWADEYLDKFDKNLHSITSCVRSNRLLSQKKLDIKNVLSKGINLHIGTDGLSSNISLNFFDELRAFLFAYSEFDVLELAKTLILASTCKAARALNLSLGSLQKGYIADFGVYEGLEISSLDQLPLQLILHTKEVKKLYIEGKQCEF